jgi:hypothetical protein
MEADKETRIAKKRSAMKRLAEKRMAIRNSLPVSVREKADQDDNRACAKGALTAL